jgi:CheY-like chemotaxis protein
LDAVYPQNLESFARCFTPVILITAFLRPNLEKQAAEAGAAFFVEKPVSPDILLHILSTV